MKTYDIRCPYCGRAGSVFSAEDAGAMECGSCGAVIRQEVEGGMSMVRFFIPKERLRKKEQFLLYWD